MLHAVFAGRSSKMMSFQLHISATWPPIFQTLSTCRYTCNMVCLPLKPLKTKKTKALAVVTDHRVSQSSHHQIFSFGCWSLWFYQQFVFDFLTGGSFFNLLVRWDCLCPCRCSPTITNYWNFLFVMSASSTCRKCFFLVPATSHQVISILEDSRGAGHPLSPEVPMRCNY